MEKLDLVFQGGASGGVGRGGVKRRPTASSGCETNAANEGFFLTKQTLFNPLEMLTKLDSFRLLWAGVIYLFIYSFTLLFSI